MVIEVLQKVISRDLKKLVQELSLYKDEANIWRVDKNIINPAGNLCLHLVGNLNTYFGAVLANTGYIRNRDLEFSQKDVSRAELIRKTEDAIQVVDKALSNMTDDDLKKDYPLPYNDETVTTEYFLIHLSIHLGYHLGQVNYHRRLLDT